MAASPAFADTLAIGPHVLVDGDASGKDDQRGTLTLAGIARGFRATASRHRIDATSASNRLSNAPSQPNRPSRQIAPMTRMSAPTKSARTYASPRPASTAALPNVPRRNPRIGTHHNHAMAIIAIV